MSHCPRHFLADFGLPKVRGSRAPPRAPVGPANRYARLQSSFHAGPQICTYYSSLTLAMSNSNKRNRSAASFAHSPLILCWFQTSSTVTVVPHIAILCDPNTVLVSYKVTVVLSRGISSAVIDLYVKCNLACPPSFPAHLPTTADFFPLLQAGRPS